MKRYAISPVTGSGTFLDPFRAGVQNVAGVNVVALIPTGSNGHPLYHFALCLVAAGNFTLVSQVSNLYLFPDVGLDTRMDAMQDDARTGLVQSVQAYDLDGAGKHLDATNADGDSFRALLTRLGRQIDATFDADFFGVSEVSQ